jgi:uncharacterized protein
MRVHRQQLAGAPALLVAPDGEPEPRPAVLWFHGFGADKDVHLPELERIAGLGMTAVGIDAVGHGERRLADLQERIDAPREQAHRTAVDLAVATAAEVPAVVAALRAAVPVTALGAVGISMGGYTVYRALVDEPAIEVAVALLGSPEWPHPASPHQRLDAFARVALLSVTAECDANVPPAAARALHRRLAAAHPAAVQRSLELPGGVHLMSAAHWDITMDATLEWLRRLRADG